MNNKVKPKHNTGKSDLKRLLENGCAVAELWDSPVLNFKIMGIDLTLKAARQKIYRIQNRMRVIKRSLRHDGIKEDLISEYLYLNNQLKGAKIIEAQLTYYRNRL